MNENKCSPTLAKSCKIKAPSAKTQEIRKNAPCCNSTDGPVLPIEPRLFKQFDVSDYGIAAATAAGARAMNCES